VKFLIVDDDPLCRELLRVILRPYGRCDLAAGGEEALRFVRAALEAEEPYDLICLDIMMPGMDGHEVLRSIRQIEHHHGRQGSDAVKVIMTTALKDTRHCIRAFEEGCESYCTKPLTEEKILAEMRALLGEGALKSGCVSIDSPPPVSSAAVASHTPATSQVLPDGYSPETAPTAHTPDTPPAQALLRCLIVDDDRVCRELLRAMLTPYAECSFAYDGTEAVEAVRLALEDGLPYELICLDIMMPGMDGHQALEQIRAVENEHGLRGLDGAKVIMTTALRDSKHCVRSFREGCEAYVTKPIREEELLAKMQQLGLLASVHSSPSA